MAQKYKAKNDKQQSSKRALFTALLLVVLIIGASALFSYTKSKNKGTSDNSKSSATDTSVNLSPPTKEEEKETETFKDNLEKPTETKVETENGKKQVSPIITGADESEVNGYIPSVLEDGGSCVAKFTKDNETLEFTSAGFGNVSYTTCEPIAISGLGKGSWSVKLSYSSSTAEGTSQVSKVEIK